MNRLTHLGIPLAVIILLFFVFPQTAYADIDVVTFNRAAYAYYIDVGTGSLIIQVLIGGFVGGLAIIGIYRMRIKDFLHNLFKKRKDDEESE